MTTQPRAVAQRPTTNGALVHVDGYTREQVELVKAMVAPNVTDLELRFFLARARALGLDPLANQIHAVKRWDAKAGKEVMAIQVGIGGVRAIAQRTGELEGYDGPYWCGPDGVWSEVWLDDDVAPFAAKCTVFRKGWRMGTTRVVKWSEFVQKNKDGQVNATWNRLKSYMLGKCAETAATNAQFPAETAGIYSASDGTPVDVDTYIEAESEPIVVDEATGELRDAAPEAPAREPAPAAQPTQPEPAKATAKRAPKLEPDVEPEPAVDPHAGHKSAAGVVYLVGDGKVGIERQGQRREFTLGDEVPAGREPGGEHLGWSIDTHVIAVDGDLYRVVEVLRLEAPADAAPEPAVHPNFV